MNDAEYEAQKTRIQALTERWVGPLGLKWWRITMEYERDSGRFRSDTNAAANDILAVSEPDWRYMMATITWNMRLVSENDDEYLELSFVHELMHVMLHELRVDDTHHNAAEERIVTWLARAFVWVRDFTQEGKAPAIPPALSKDTDDIGARATTPVVTLRNTVVYRS